MGNWIIRKMQEKDLEEVAAIEKRTFTDAWSLLSFREELDNPYAVYICVQETQEGPIAAYCGYIRSFEDAEILNVAVDAPFRGRGIAREMMTRLMEYGRSEGVENFTLEVRAGNAAAIALYEKLGFRSVGEHRNFYSNPREDALIMWYFAAEHRQDGKEHVTE